MATGIKRTYTNFTGVDFMNEPSLVNITRSPDALNVWKDYKKTKGTCIETRPGYRKIAQIGDKINGIYIYNQTKAIIHSGTKLYEWNNFPNEPDENNIKELYLDMNNIKSSFNIVKQKLYINDGKNYLVYDGIELKEVKEGAFIPRTTISRKAGKIGGGEILQDVNLLQPKRINSFIADGENKEFCFSENAVFRSKVWGQALFKGLAGFGAEPQGLALDLKGRRHQASSEAARPAAHPSKSVAQSPRSELFRAAREAEQ